MAIKLIRADHSYAKRMDEVGRKAFKDDAWALAIFPKRLQDPEDPNAQKRFMLERMEKRLSQEGIYSIIAVDEDIRDQDGQVRVLAYSAWHAPGKGDNEEEDRLTEHPQEDGQEETGEEGGWVDDGQGGKRGDGKKYPRVMDVEAWWKLNEVLKSTKQEILGAERANIWYLGSLGVDPNFAGRGIASQLAQWGLKKAEEDGVPAYLESTFAARGVYRRAGFEIIREMPTMEDGGQPHTAMLWRPGKHNV